MGPDNENDVYPPHHFDSPLIDTVLHEDKDFFSPLASALSRTRSDATSPVFSTTSPTTTLSSPTSGYSGSLEYTLEDISAGARSLSPAAPCNSPQTPDTEQRLLQLSGVDYDRIASYRGKQGLYCNNSGDPRTTRSATQVARVTTQHFPDPFSKLSTSTPQLGHPGSRDKHEFHGRPAEDSKHNKAWSEFSIHQDWKLQKTHQSANYKRSGAPGDNIDSKHCTPPAPHLESPDGNPPAADDQLNRPPQFSDPGAALQWLRGELVELRTQDKELQDQFLRLYRGIQDLRVARRNSKPTSSTEASLISQAMGTPDSMQRTLSALMSPKGISPAVSSKPADATLPVQQLSNSNNRGGIQIPPTDQPYHVGNHMTTRNSTQQPCFISRPYRPLPAPPSFLQTRPTLATISPSNSLSTNNGEKGNPGKKTSKAGKIKKHLLTGCFTAEANEVRERKKVSMVGLLTSVIGKRQRKSKREADLMVVSEVTKVSASCSSTVMNHQVTKDMISGPVPYKTEREKTEYDNESYVYMNNTPARDVAFVQRFTQKENMAHQFQDQTRLNKPSGSQSLQDVRVQDKYPIQKFYSDVPLTHCDVHQERSTSKQSIRPSNCTNYLGYGASKMHANLQQPRSITEQVVGIGENNGNNHFQPQNRPPAAPPKADTYDAYSLQPHYDVLPQPRGHMDWTKSSLALFSPMSMELSDNYYSLSDDEDYFTPYQPMKFYRRSQRWFDRDPRCIPRRRNRYYLSPLAESVELASSCYSLSDSESTFYGSEVERSEYYIPSGRRRNRRRRRGDSAYWSDKAYADSYRSRSKLSLRDSSSSGLQDNRRHYYRDRDENRYDGKIARELQSVPQDKVKDTIYEQHYRKATKTRAPVLVNQRPTRHSSREHLSTKKDRRSQRHHTSSIVSAAYMDKENRLNLNDGGVRRWRKEKINAGSENPSLCSGRSMPDLRRPLATGEDDIYQNMIATAEWVV